MDNFICCRRRRSSLMISLWLRFVDIKMVEHCCCCFDSTSDKTTMKIGWLRKY